MVVLGVTVAMSAPLTMVSAPEAHGASVPSGGSYVPMNPVRIVDTRINQGVAGPVRGQQSVTMAVPAGVAPPGAATVALNVTAVDGTGDGSLSVYADGSPRPATSNLNFRGAPGSCWSEDCVVPNLVITSISSTGRFDVFSGQAATDSVNVIVDVEGYFNSASATDGAQGHYYPLASSRLSDSRCGESPSAPGPACSSENIPAANAHLTTMSAGSTQNVTVAGQGPVPASGAEAAVVQLTATNTSADGYLAVNPTGGAPTNGSNVNFAAGQTTSTVAIVKLGSGGAITLHNCCGSTDVVVDVVGYFSDATAALQGGSLYNATTATRLSDSRPANGGLGPIPTNASRAVPVTGNAAVPPGSTSAVISLTEATATASSYMTVTPNALNPPASTSNVAFGSGDIRANADLATLSGSEGTLSVYNLAGSTDFIVDVFGYFIPAANVPAQGGGGPSPYAGFVGVNSLLIYDSEQYAQASLTTLASGGIAWDRENFSWGNLEPRPGVWDWTEGDALMTAAAKTGNTIRILGLLGHVAPWASADPHP
ncbi:MAG: hypothetical protein M3Y36_05090, partial [Actinomycetota bacterium]|nr:hypothetical protein [Actinomycetota bacterium]